MRHHPNINHISSAVIRAFAFMVGHPDEWVTVPRLVAEGGAAKATIYRRFGNLVAAGALQERCGRPHRQFKLSPRWQGIPLAVELHRRSQNEGAILRASNLH